MDPKCYVNVRILAAAIFNNISRRIYGDQCPLTITGVLLQVSSLALASQVKELAVVGPRSESKQTNLLVKGKERYVDLANGFDFCRCKPFVSTIVVQDNHSVKVVHFSSDAVNAERA